MKKLMISLMVVGVIGIALASAAVVSAKGPTQQPYLGQGGTDGYGWRGSEKQGTGLEIEAVHDLSMEAWSQELGISVDELNTRTDAGETLAQIAFSTGMTFDDFRITKDEINQAVAVQALAEGLITQEEANLLQQGPERQLLGDGTGIGTGIGMRGSGTSNSAVRGSGSNDGVRLYDGTGCPN